MVMQVSALNEAAGAGGFYHNTGEGGLTSFHKLGGDVVWNVGTGCSRTNIPFFDS